MNESLNNLHNPLDSKPFILSTTSAQEQIPDQLSYEHTHENKSTNRCTSVQESRMCLHCKTKTMAKH